MQNYRCPPSTKSQYVILPEEKKQKNRKKEKISPPIPRKQQRTDITTIEAYAQMRCRPCRPLAW